MSTISNKVCVELGPHIASYIANLEVLNRGDDIIGQAGKQHRLLPRARGCPSLPPQSQRLSPTAQCWHARDALLPSTTQIIQLAQRQFKHDFVLSWNAIYCIITALWQPYSHTPSRYNPVLVKGLQGLPRQSLGPVGANRTQGSDSGNT